MTKSVYGMDAKSGQNTLFLAGMLLSWDMKKIVIIILLLINIDVIYGMDFLVSRRYDDKISGPIFVGVSLVGLGLWRGIEAYCGAGHHNNIPDETRKMVEYKKILDQSIVTVGVGVSLLSFLASDQSFSYTISMMR